MTLSLKQRAEEALEKIQKFPKWNGRAVHVVEQALQEAYQEGRESMRREVFELIKNTAAPLLGMAQWAKICEDALLNPPPKTGKP